MPFARVQGWAVVQRLTLTTTLALMATPAVWAMTVFQESAGQVVIESEHYDAKVPRGGKDWSLQTSVSGSAGTGYLQALPNTGVTIDTGYTTTSPEISFNVQFTTTGTYYVWIRGSAANGNDDSLHAGLDGAAISSADRISGFRSWTWKRDTLDQAPATLVISSPGIHTIHLWMREDGVRVDRLLLRTNSSATAPSGTGPAESPRVTSDVTPPSTPSVTDSGSVTNSTTQLTASWTASQDPESGVIEYQYRMIEGVTLAVIRDWTSTGLNQQVTATGLMLQHGATYYFSVRAKNGVGLFSATGDSDGILVDAQAPVISAVTATAVTGSSAQITWTTDEPSTSQAQYGLTTSYGQSSPLDSTVVTQHSVPLTGLSAQTVYHVRALSNDPAGNATMSTDQTFQTLQTPTDLFVVPSTDKVLPEVGLPTTATAPPATLGVARNEAESVQLVLRNTGQALQQVNVTISDLQQTDGPGIIPQTAVSWSPVGFVHTQTPSYPVSHVGYWPDPLPAAAPFDVAQNWLQPIWITVTVPTGTPAGTYTGTITVTPTNAAAVQTTLQVTVWNVDLPVTPTFRTAFDLYVNRLKSGYSTFFPQWWSTWQTQFAQLVQLYYDHMIKNRIAPILNIEPDNPRVINYLENATVPTTLTLPAPGLQGMLDRGLSGLSIGQYAGGLGNRWPTTQPQLDALIPTYQQYAQALRTNGWINRHYLYTWDEPTPGSQPVKDVCNMVHRADPQLRNLVTIGGTFDVATLGTWFQDMDIVSIRNADYTPTRADQLRQQGKELWTYVSGPIPPYPTLVIDYPSMDYRILPWMCWKFNLKGLLYWSVDYWTTNPYQNPMNTPWGQNGNGSLYYPGANGPVSSIRVEVVRDSVDDYEYLVILSNVTAQVRANPTAMADPAVQARVVQADQHLTIPLVTSMSQFNTDPAALLTERSQIAGLIEQLQVDATR